MLSTKGKRWKVKSRKIIFRIYLLIWICVLGTTHKSISINMRYSSSILLRSIIASHRLGWRRTAIDVIFCPILFIWTGVDLIITGVCNRHFQNLTQLQSCHPHILLSLQMEKVLSILTQKCQGWAKSTPLCRTELQSKTLIIAELIPFMRSRFSIPEHIKTY